MANQKTYKILERDPYLADFAGDIELRMRLYQETKKRILGKEKKISSFANGNLLWISSGRGYLGLPGMGARSGCLGVDRGFQRVGQAGESHAEN